VFHFGKSVAAQQNHMIVDTARVRGELSITNDATLTAQGNMTRKAVTVKFKIGQRVFYLNQNEVGTIVGYGEKHGEVVYDVELANGETYYGYANDFRKVS
jgi:Xrn1 SH3-like domain